MPVALISTRTFARAGAFEVDFDDFKRLASAAIRMRLRASVNRRSQEMHGDVMIRHRQSMRGAPGSSFTVK
jgi:hypothetical protein